MVIGTELYQLVVEYAEIGNHRTGTAVDRLTRDWLAEQLGERGGQVEQQAYEFDQYLAALFFLVLEPIQFVMERRMLLGIKERAEAPN